MNSGVSAISAERRADQIEQPLLHHLDARQRQSRQLQARQRADFGQLDLVEFVQDLLGAEMDFDRQRQEGLGAAVDDLGRRPRQQQIDRVGLERAHAGDRLGEVAIEHRAPRFGGCGQRHRREKAAADDIEAERPRLVMLHEGADMGAGADQADALRRNQPGGARQRRDAHDGKAQHDQSGERGEIEQHDPAARIIDRGLRQEAEHEQADQRDVPQLDGAAGVRLEGEEIRQPVFAAEHVGDGENAGRQDADLDVGGDVADVAVDDEVIDNAGEERHRDDEGDVDQEDRDGKRAARQLRPGAQDPARSAPARPACSWFVRSSARLRCCPNGDARRPEMGQRETLHAGYIARSMPVTQGWRGWRGSRRRCAAAGRVKINRAWPATAAAG